MASDKGDNDKTRSTEDTSKTPPPNRNAFTEMMSPKSKQRKSELTPSTTKTQSQLYNPRDYRHGLFPYIASPESHPVISHNASFVVINDAFPKATVHLLVLPRDTSKALLDPRTALSTDATFLAAVRAEASSAAQLAAKELARLLGPYSATEQERTAAMDSASSPEDLPPGRDWLSYIRMGIHAHPSMAHVHIHVFSVDMHSDWMGHRKHYNSFNTPFFIPLDAFPLAEDDPRWETSVQNANLRLPFICWRCSEEFKGFKELKRHLEVAFEKWRAE